MTSYSQILHRAAPVEGGLSFSVPEDWMQGRSVFGGLQAALMLAAARAHEPSAPLRTIQATFLAPLGPGAGVARASVLRRGKSAAHVEASIGAAGSERAAQLVAVFGAPRASAARLLPARSAPPDEVDLLLPFIPGVTPNFTQHFRARWRLGAPPFTGLPTPRCSVALELADADARGATEAHVLALADLLPPIALSYLVAPAPGSTLTWMLELTREDLGGLGLAGWIVDAELTWARDGYTSQRALLWAPDGGLAAISAQSMTVFG